jgi:hypothetical protein
MIRDFGSEQSAHLSQQKAMLASTRPEIWIEEEKIPCGMAAHLYKQELPFLYTCERMLFF